MDFFERVLVRCGQVDITEDECRRQNCYWSVSDKICFTTAVGGTSSSTQPTNMVSLYPPAYPPTQAGFITAVIMDFFERVLVRCGQVDITEDECRRQNCYWSVSDKICFTTAVGGTSSSTQPTNMVSLYPPAYPPTQAGFITGIVVAAVLAVIFLVLWIVEIKLQLIGNRLPKDNSDPSAGNDEAEKGLIMRDTFAQMLNDNQDERINTIINNRDFTDKVIEKLLKKDLVFDTLSEEAKFTERVMKSRRDDVYEKIATNEDDWIAFINNKNFASALNNKDPVFRNHLLSARAVQAAIREDFKRLVDKFSNLLSTTSKILHVRDADETVVFNFDNLEELKNNVKIVIAKVVPFIGSTEFDDDESARGDADDSLRMRQPERAPIRETEDISDSVSKALPESVRHVRAIRPGSRLSGTVIAQASGDS